jgi:hypothetical protein
MTASRPAPVYDDLGEIIAFEAVERALDSARHEVIRARACWANWARRTTRAIEEAEGPEARDTAWLQLRRVYSAASQAEASGKRVKFWSSMKEIRDSPEPARRMKRI